MGVVTITSSYHYKMYACSSINVRILVFCWQFLKLFVYYFIDSCLSLKLMMICYILKVKQYKLKYVWAHVVSICWMLPQATCCYIHCCYLHPLHFVSIKCKDLVAKQHLTNVCCLVLVESTAVYILYTLLCCIIMLHLYTIIFQERGNTTLFHFYIHSNNVDMNICVNFPPL